MQYKRAVLVRGRLFLLCLSVYCILLYFSIFIHCPSFTSACCKSKFQYFHVLQSLSSALPPSFSNPKALHGNAEPSVSGRLQCSIEFLHIEPLHALHFLFLQGKLFSIYMLGVHVDECHFIVPEHFSIEFFFVLNVKTSCECKILFCGPDSQFFVKLPDCGLFRLIPSLNMSGGRGIEPPRETIFLSGALL